MKKGLSFVIISIAFLLFTSLGKRECSSFKTGKYVVKGQTYTTYIERFDNYQTEYTPENGLKIKSKISWETDCYYSIGDYEVLENPDNDDVSYIEGGTTVYFEIIKVKKNSILTLARNFKNSEPIGKIIYHRQ